MSNPEKTEMTAREAFKAATRPDQWDALLTNPDSLREVFAAQTRAGSPDQSALSFQRAIGLAGSSQGGDSDARPVRLAGDGAFLCLVRDDKEDELLDEALVLRQKGEFKKSEAVLKKLLEHQETTYGKDSAPMTVTLSVLGGVAELAEDYKGAREYYKRGVEISKKAYKEGPDNVMTALHTAGMAKMDARLKNWKESAAEYKEALRIYEKHDIAKMPPNHQLNIANTYIEYAGVLTQLGDKVEAAKQAKKATEILDRLLKKKGKTIDV